MSNTSPEQTPLAVPAPAKDRVRGRVFSYNYKEGFGHARLPDNRVVWLDSNHLLEPIPRPFPGDIVEFELRSTRNGLQARKIQVVLEEGKKQAGVIVSTTPARAGPQSQKTPSQPKLKQPSKTSLVQPKTRPPTKGTDKSQGLYQKAAVARAEGRTQDARRFFKQSIEAGAGTQVYVAFAKMELERGTRAEARQILQQGLELFPDYADFYVMYGQMERRARNYARSEQVFRQGLERCSSNHTLLLMGLAQTLVQTGTEKSLREAGEIFKSLEKRGKLNKHNRFYQRFEALQKNPRANKAYDFFQMAGMRVGIAGRRNLPAHITDLAVEISSQELSESFGLSGAFLVRCFRRQPKPIELVDLNKYLRDFGVSGVLGLQDGREVVINSSLAFVAVPNSDAVRDQIMSILGESSEVAQGRIQILGDMASPTPTWPVILRLAA